MPHSRRHGVSGSNSPSLPSDSGAQRAQTTSSLIHPCTSRSRSQLHITSIPSPSSHHPKSHNTRRNKKKYICNKRGFSLVPSMLLGLRPHPRQFSLLVRRGIRSHLQTRPVGILSMSASMTSSTSQNGKKEEGKKEIYFSSFEVTRQVFYTTPLSYALVNLKPILPGHVLVVPFRLVPRLTDLTPAELQDLFCAVQKVQDMLARKYFKPLSSLSSGRQPQSQNPPTQSQSQPSASGPGNSFSPPSPSSTALGGAPTDGSFNIAIQDGREAGQTVPHVHVHVIPRLHDDDAGDEVYAHLQGEEGNVGGGFWDRSYVEQHGERPIQRGKFPRIEDEQRKPRDEEEMRKEAEGYKMLMTEG